MNTVILSSTSNAHVTQISFMQLQAELSIWLKFCSSCVQLHLGVVQICDFLANTRYSLLCSKCIDFCGIPSNIY